MRPRLAGVAGVAATVILLTGCGSSTPSPSAGPAASESVTRSENHAEFGFQTVQTPNGPIECVTSARNHGFHQAGGLSCNWEKYNKAR